jgi:hypothetical protein
MPSLTSQEQLTFRRDNELLLSVVNKKLWAGDKVEFAPASQQGILAFRMKDLKHAFAIDTESETATAVIDPKTGKIYTHSITRGLMICDANGKIVRELAITRFDPDPTILQLFVHPEGGKLLAWAGSSNYSRLIYIELPKDL